MVNLEFTICTQALLTPFGLTGVGETMRIHRKQQEHFVFCSIKTSFLAVPYAVHSSSVDSRRNQLPFPEHCICRSISPLSTTTSNSDRSEREAKEEPRSPIFAGKVILPRVRRRQRLQRRGNGAFSPSHPQASTISAWAKILWIYSIFRHFAQIIHKPMPNLWTDFRLSCGAWKY